MQMIRQYIRNRRGSAIVEMALILPVFLLMLIGMLEFGMVLHDYIMITEAARAGARAAAVGTEDSGILDVVQKAAPSLDQGKLVVTITPPGKGNRPVGTAATVTLTYPVDIPVPSIANPFSGGGGAAEFAILPSDINLIGTAVMRVER